MTNAPYSFKPSGDGGSIHRGGARLCYLALADLPTSELVDFGDKMAAALNAYNPHEKAFTDLPPAERRDRVLTALDPALRTLLAAVGTVEVGNLVAPLVIGRQATPPELKLILTALVALAPVVPEAQRSEAQFERFGKTMRRWVWSPRLDND